MSAAGMTYGRLLLWIVGGIVLVFLLSPILIIILTSFGRSPFLEFPPTDWSLRWYANFFTSRHWVDPTLLSLQVACVTTLGATTLGTLAALALARGRVRGKRAIEFFIVSPIIVPLIVLAIGLYFLFAELQLVGRPVSLYLGHTVIATPLVFIIVSAALRSSDPSLELAARSLGANYTKALWHVTLPAIRPGILSGAAFAFLVSFDEVVIAIFVGGPEATTLPKRMWDSIRFEIDPTLTAISSLLVLVAVGILVCAEFLSRSMRGDRS